MAPRMEWTDEMIELLLHAVFKAGLHTKFHKVGVADEWKELTQELFQMKAFSSSALFIGGGVRGDYLSQSIYRYYCT